MKDHADLLKIDHNSLIAFNVTSEFKSDFRKCVEKLSIETQTENVLCKSRDDESSMLYDVIISGPCITPPHADNSESGHIILQFYKTKLIIWWDMIDEILKKYNRLHCRNIVEDLALTAIKT